MLKWDLTAKTPASAELDPHQISDYKLRTWQQHFINSQNTEEIRGAAVRSHMLEPGGSIIIFTASLQDQKNKKNREQERTLTFFITCLEYTTVKHFGSLTWRLFGHPVPHSTAHFVHRRCCRVLQLSDLTATVRCSPSTCDRFRYEEENLAGAHTEYPEKLKEADAEGGELVQGRQTSSLAPTATNRKSNKYTTVSLSLVLPTEQQGTWYTYQSPVYNIHISHVTGACIVMCV